MTSKPTDLCIWVRHCLVVDFSQIFVVKLRVWLWKSSEYKNWKINVFSPFLLVFFRKWFTNCNSEIVLSKNSKRRPREPHITIMNMACFYFGSDDSIFIPAPVTFTHQNKQIKFFHRKQSIEERNKLQTMQYYVFFYFYLPISTEHLQIWGRYISVRAIRDTYTHDAYAIISEINAKFKTTIFFCICLSFSLTFVPTRSPYKRSKNCKLYTIFRVWNVITEWYTQRIHNTYLFTKQTPSQWSEIHS